MQCTIPCRALKEEGVQTNCSAEDRRRTKHRWSEGVETPTLRDSRR
nr:MAG TPA: hypothetical protein [Caudoviricetes sp.]